jgi:hypothetical protein
MICPSNNLLQRHLELGTQTVQSHQWHHSSSRQPILSRENACRSRFRSQRFFGQRASREALFRLGLAHPHHAGSSPPPFFGLHIFRTCIVLKPRSSLLFLLPFPLTRPPRSAHDPSRPSSPSTPRASAAAAPPPRRPSAAAPASIPRHPPPSLRHPPPPPQRPRRAAAGGADSDRGECSAGAKPPAPQRTRALESEATSRAAE